MQKDEVFFWSILSFILGILCGSFFDFPFEMLLLLGSAFSAALLAVFFRKAVIIAIVFFFAWCGGAYLASSELAVYRDIPLSGEMVRGEARIISDPQEKDFFRQILLRFETCTSGNCPKERILWQAPLSFEGEAGTRLSFACMLERPKNWNNEFDYRMFLAKDGIAYSCPKAEQAVVQNKDMWGKGYTLLYAPKHALERALSRILSEPEAGLAKGLLLGGDNYLPQALKDAFANVGLSHMIAVSGYNITLIAEMLLWVGLFFGLWRKQAIWAALFGIVFFIMMIGMPASASRAGAMAGVVFVALQTGRLARPVNALLFAAAVMLYFHPLLLRYDLGFQLSFLATLGILWVAPYQKYFSSFGFLLRHTGEIILMTLAVELFVLPVILLSFHTFSPLVIVGNFLVILVPFAMATAFGAALLFLLMPGAHVVLAWSAFGLLSLMTRSVEWLGSFGGASITAESFDEVSLIGWYLLLGLLILAVHRFFPPKPYKHEQEV